MDGTQGPDKSSELYARLCTGTAPFVLDLRRGGLVTICLSANFSPRPRMLVQGKVTL